MSIARPNPDITRRPSVPGFHYRMSVPQGNSSCRSHAGGLGKETSKVSLSFHFMW